MARLAVTPCTTCGAPLSHDPAVALEITCPYCKRVTRWEPTVEPKPADGRGVGFALAAMLAGIVLVIVLGTTVDWLRNRDDSDRVVRLQAPEAATDVFVTRATLAPDGALWMACRSELLCHFASDGTWLGSVSLPTPEPDDFVNSARTGVTWGLAADRAGRLYVSHGRALLEVSMATRVIAGRSALLSGDEHATCLAVGADDALWLMTSGDDLVSFGADRKPRVRWKQPLTGVDPRHHGCDSLALDGQGQVYVTPQQEPAIYVFSPEGKLLRRHAPGGPANYTGLLPLSDGKVLVGYYYELLLFDAAFRPLPGPKLPRDSWGFVTDLVETHDRSVLVMTQLGFLARWGKAGRKW